MKKVVVSLMLISLGAIGIVSAQTKELPFFDEKGTVRIQTLEMDAMADTIATVYHRADDVAWSRVVYKIIDMRDKQNYQLYFPTRPNDEYVSLFRLMLNAITQGVPVYARNPREIKPMWDTQLTGEDLSQVFAYDEYREDNLIQVNPVTNEATISDEQYQRYVHNQVKFLIQEIYFFDKHYSRMYSKIMAIAPLYALHPDNLEANNSMRYFQNSILCWFAYDDLRPFMIKQFVIPKKNDTQRLSFDDFFVQNLYGTYLLGDSNMYNRMLLDYGTIIADTTQFTNYIKSEQNRIQTELLNFEMDMWDY
ncbi:MAG: gliding motility protein GldN [Paludibacter sp.]|nr:gliding motility protein GldN [Paludibacter sp.]